MIHYGFDSATGKCYRFPTLTDQDEWRRVSPESHGGTRRGVNPWPHFEGSRALKWTWVPKKATGEYGDPITFDESVEER